MRSTGILSLALSAPLLLLGCGKDTSPPPDSKAKISNATEKIRDAAAATTEAAKAKRDEYARAMSKQLEELTAKYDELKSRVGKAGDQAKQGLEKKLEEAKVKRDAAAKTLDELKEAAADRWEKVKVNVGNALEDLKKVFE